MSEVTVILNAIERGDAKAPARLLPLVYEELRRLARRYMDHERTEHTLQATALVHEAYLRLVGAAPMRWESRGQFFAIASEAMRRILVEHARRKKAIRHGGGEPHFSLADDDLPAIAAGCRTPDEVLDLNEALDRLAEEDPDKSELVKLTYFGGFSPGEAAEALGLSRATAYRHLTFARAWLRNAIGDRAGSRIS